MGYYTKLKLNLTLSYDAPFNILVGLCSKELTNKIFTDRFGDTVIAYNVADSPEIPIDHIFGKSHRWVQIFEEACIENNQLYIRCDIKAYDDIYEHLVDWLSPYIIKGKVEIKGEESDRYTTLYNKDY